MFWRFAPVLSQLDSILDKEDITLSEILDEDDVIQECKSHNQKLVDILIIPENLLFLVKLVIDEPSEDIPTDTKYRLPNIASELLSSDIKEINDALVDETNEYLDLLFNTFDPAVTLNPLMASFIVRIMTVLFQRKGEKVVEFFKSKDDFLEKVLAHLGTSAMMDFLLKFIQYTEPLSARTQVIEWLTEKKLITQLIDQLGPNDEEEKHSNTCQCLCSLLMACREQSSQTQDSGDMNGLLDTLQSQETLSDLLNHMLKPEITESVLVTGLTYLQNLLEQKKSESPLDSFLPTSQVDLDRLAVAGDNVIDAIIPRLSEIRIALEKPPWQHYNEMPTSFGQLSPPLGNTRLQIIRLLLSLLSLNSTKMNYPILEHNFLELIMDAFFKYEWNTFLHKVTENIVFTILSNSISEAITSDVDLNTTTISEHMGCNQKLLMQMIVDNKFIEKMLDAWAVNEQDQFKKPSGRRRGYMGHLTNIANMLVDNFLESKEPSTFVKVVLNGLEEDLVERWRKFADEDLNEVNQRNKIDLHSFMGSESPSEDEDSDYHLPSSLSLQLQQSFTDYQNQTMTDSFLEHFGYCEDEFNDSNMDKIDYMDRIVNIDFSVATQEDTPNATMFEQACNEEIRQFDDSEEESDDEVDFVAGNSTADHDDEGLSATGESVGFNFPRGLASLDDDLDDTIMDRELRRLDSGMPRLLNLEDTARININFKPKHNLQLRSSGSSDDDDDEEDDEDLQSPRVIIQSTRGRAPRRIGSGGGGGEEERSSRGIDRPVQVATPRGLGLTIENMMDVDVDDWPDMEEKVNKLDTTEEDPDKKSPLSSEEVATPRTAWGQDNNNSSFPLQPVVSEESKVVRVSYAVDDKVEHDDTPRPSASNKTPEATTVTSSNGRLEKTKWAQPTSLVIPPAQTNGTDEEGDEDEDEKVGDVGITSSSLIVESFDSVAEDRLSQVTLEDAKVEGATTLTTTGVVSHQSEGSVILINKPALLDSRTRTHSPSQKQLSQSSTVIITTNTEVSPSSEETTTSNTTNPSSLSLERRQGASYRSSKTLILLKKDDDDEDGDDDSNSKDYDDICLPATVQYWFPLKVSERSDGDSNGEVKDQDCSVVQSHPVSSEVANGPV